MHSDSYFCRCLDGTWFLPLKALEQWQEAGAKQSAALLQLWMDGCKAAPMQPKQLFNHTKRLHLLDHLSFYMKSSLRPVTLLRILSNTQAHNARTSSRVRCRISPRYNGSLVLAEAAAR